MNSDVWRNTESGNHGITGIRLISRELAGKLVLAFTILTATEARWTYHDQIGTVPKKGQAKSILSWQACIKVLMRVNEEKDLFKGRSKYKTVVFA